MALRILLACIEVHNSKANFEWFHSELLLCWTMISWWAIIKCYHETYITCTVKQFTNFNIYEGTIFLVSVTSFCWMICKFNSSSHVLSFGYLNSSHAYHFSLHQSHANRYKRYIVPVLSVYMDFYVRVFVRVFTWDSLYLLSVQILYYVLYLVLLGSASNHHNIWISLQFCKWNKEYPT